MAIAPGHEDINDHDRQRDDGLFATAVGRERRRERDRGHPLAAPGTPDRLDPDVLGEAE